MYEMVVGVDLINKLEVQNKPFICMRWWWGVDLINKLEVQNKLFICMRWWWGSI